jgi:hypothetical protein
VVASDPDGADVFVDGRRVEIECFVSDPNESPPVELARLTMRLGPF